MIGSKSWLDDPKQHIKIACRLCGDVWKFPLTYKYAFELVGENGERFTERYYKLLIFLNSRD